MNTQTSLSVRSLLPLYALRLPEDGQDILQTQAREKRAEGERRHGQAVLGRPTDGECPVRQRKLDFDLSLFHHVPFICTI